MRTCTLLVGGPLRTQFDDVVVSEVVFWFAFSFLFSNFSQSPVLSYASSQNRDCISSSALQCDSFYLDTCWP